MPKIGRGDPMVRSDGRTKPDRNWYPEDFDWYLKWIASFLILASLTMRAAGPEYLMYDLVIVYIGIVLCTWVSIIWKDRALIMLNTISGFMLLTTILREW